MSACIKCAEDTANAVQPVATALAALTAKLDALIALVMELRDVDDPLTEPEEDEDMDCRPQPYGRSPPEWFRK